MSSKSSYGSALAGPEDARVSQRYLPSDRSLPKQRAVGAFATGPRRTPSESRDALSSAQSARLPAGLMTTGNLARPPSPVRRRPSRRPEGIAHRPRPNVSARERRHRRPKHWLCSGGEFVGPHAREGRGELFPTCELFGRRRLRAGGDLPSRRTIPARRVNSCFERGGLRLTSPRKHEPQLRRAAGGIDYPCRRPSSKQQQPLTPISMTPAADGYLTDHVRPVGRIAPSPLVHPDTRRPTP